MEDPFENDNIARPWIEVRCEDPGIGHLWIRARCLYKFKRAPLSVLYLFQTDIPELQEANPQHAPETRIWSRKVHNGIRVLFDRIVTRWEPNRLSQDLRRNCGLHISLTPESLLVIPEIFDHPPAEFNGQRAQNLYEQCFIPLLYHELWESMKKDIKSTMTFDQMYSADGNIEIEIIRYERCNTRAPHRDELPIPTTLIFGSYNFQVDLSFNRTLPKLGLCDIVLINIDFIYNRRSFFATVVHIEDNWPIELETVSDNKSADDNEKSIIEVKSKVVLYTSKVCSDMIQTHCRKSKTQTISLVRISNFISARRQISAIYNLCQFPKRESLLKPSYVDPYFVHDGIHGANLVALANFNYAQKQVILNAARMFDNDDNDHLHLVHGPPGTGKSRTIAGIVKYLIPKLDKNKKILICAPSNNACDDLCIRILDELDADYDTDVLVRVGREAPLDHLVCEHFLESLTMQRMVNMMQNEEPITSETIETVKPNILNNAKVIVSTLNYSANNALVSIKTQKSVKLIIIDEACQSLEADCLLPFYFGCCKIILVGDPQQLPPCVCSNIGQQYKLAQSLYTRLDARIHQENISLLNIQYRMHEAICQFPSNHFYDGRLGTDSCTIEYWPDYRLRPYYFYDLIYTEHTCSPNGVSSDNKEERTFIQRFCIRLLEALVQRSYATNDREFIEMEKRMVVITPYKRQMTKFRARSLQFPRHIEVITVDSAQGKEKDIVLISCVRSNNGTIGFLQDQNRLNVMLTRARRALYIFGNLTWLAERNPHWDALVDDAVDRQVIDTIRTGDQEIQLPF